MARFAQQGHMLAAGPSNHTQQYLFHVDSQDSSACSQDWARHFTLSTLAS
jgi:hypothetical protein